MIRSFAFASGLAFVLVLPFPVTDDPPVPDMDAIAESYVKLVLSVGQHDPDYVDAYYGPEKWKKEAESSRLPLAEIGDRAGRLLSDLADIGTRARFDEMGYLRLRYLTGQLESLRTRVEMLEGKHFTFDEEARLLYDASPPTYGKEHFEEILGQLNRILPGRDSDRELVDRLEAFRKDFIIPRDRLDEVFRTAIEECRKRTKQHLDLPENENFVVRYVTDKPWSAYNWYQGNAQSLIQVNTDLPIFIERAIDLAAHEGYPGHHVYNALLEKNLVKDRGWMEFSVYALFSPQSLIAEGSANFGKQVVFSPEERLQFERDVLFPRAGLDPARAEEYETVLRLTARLGYADNESARHYLDGDFSKDETVDWLMRYSLMSRERAEQRVKFIDKYRSYVINYNLGEDLVRTYIESQGGTSDHPEKRWEEFGKLLSSPRLPSGLQ